MPRVRQIADEIIAQLHTAPQNVAGIRAARRRISREIAALDRDTMLAVANELIHHQPFGRFVAYELVQHHGATAQAITLEEIERLACGMEDWAAVDTFSCYIAGPAWRDRRIRDRAIKKWAKSADRWWRRAALVSTVPLNQTADTERILTVCRMLMRDRDDMVVKAMSWALRARAKRDPQSVERFLSENETQLAPRVLREVRNKLTTGLKNPRKAKMNSRSKLTG